MARRPLSADEQRRRTQFLMLVDAAIEALYPDIPPQRARGVAVKAWNTCETISREIGQEG